MLFYENRKKWVSCAVVIYIYIYIGCMACVIDGTQYSDPIIYICIYMYFYVYMDFIGPVQGMHKNATNMTQDDLIDF